MPLPAVSYAVFINAAKFLFLRALISTTGTPISLIIRNEDQRSRDYGDIAGYYRPGHADYTFDKKYGFRDYRGGGRSSGRETIGRVAAGAVAARLLSELGIYFFTYSRSIGPISIQAAPEQLLSQDRARLLAVINSNPLYMPEEEAAGRAQAYLEQCMAAQNSAGGVIEAIITGVPAGVGDPMFDGIENRIARLAFAIPAVKGVAGQRSVWNSQRHRRTWGNSCEYASAGRENDSGLE